MFAPLRVALSSPCDMAGMNGMASSSSGAHMPGHDMSAMTATESMVALKGGDKDETSNWAYIMVTFKPVFFKQKPKEVPVTE